MASLQSLSITFDCLDVETQSLFWAELLGADLDEGANEFVASIGGVHSGQSPTPACSSSRSMTTSRRRTRSTSTSTIRTTRPTSTGRSHSGRRRSGRR